MLIGLAPLLLARAVPDLIDPAALSGAPSWLWLPFTVLLFAWMLAYPWALARRRQAGFPGLPRFRSVLVEALFALLAVPVIMVALTVVWVVAVYLLGEPAMATNPLESIARSPNRFEFLALMILAVSLGPVAEEMLFRGLLYNALRQRLNLVAAAVLQAIVFGFMHPFGLVGSSVVAFLGLGHRLAVRVAENAAGSDPAACPLDGHDGAGSGSFAGNRSPLRSPSSSSGAGRLTRSRWF